MRKKTWLFALLLVATTTQAEGVRFILDKPWKEILALAKKQNKLIFLDAYASWCGPCKYMQEEVFTDPKVGPFFNTNFINVKIDMEKGEGPQLSEELGVTAYPTLFFINGDGKPVHKYVGALEWEDFKLLGGEALDPERQFYTVKEKAKTGNIAPEIFNFWVRTAQTMEDPDVDDVITSYLKNTRNPIAQYHMLVTMMDYATYITEDQLKYLYKNADSAAKITMKTTEEVNDAFKKRLIAFATLKATKGEIIDFAVFKSVLLQYPPVNAELETRKLKITQLSVKKETDKAMDELAACITDPRSGVTLEELFTMVLDNLVDIGTPKYADKFIRLIKAYPISAQEKPKAFFQDLSLLSINVVKLDKEQIRYYALAVLRNKNADDGYKNGVMKIVDEYKINIDAENN